jgi:hypothetical protein
LFKDRSKENRVRNAYLVVDASNKANKDINLKPCIITQERGIVREILLQTDTAKTKALTECGENTSLSLIKELGMYSALVFGVTTDAHGHPEGLAIGKAMNGQASLLHQHDPSVLVHVSEVHICVLI